MVIGLGGVGSFVAEALVRAGISNLTLVDSDVVDITNINRQLIALSSTVGQDKVEVAKQRYLQINDKAKIQSIKSFITPENVAYLEFSKFDYVIDAIDFVPGKLAIIEQAKKENVPIISCMGTGNKLNPTLFEICDISKTSVCPLAKNIRKQLKERGIQNVTVLYSKEQPISSNLVVNNKVVPASISTVPSVAGLLIANHVILNLIK